MLDIGEKEKVSKYYWMGKSYKMKFIDEHGEENYEKEYGEKRHKELVLP